MPLGQSDATRTLFVDNLFRHSYEEESAVADRPAVAQASLRGAP